MSISAANNLGAAFWPFGGVDTGGKSGWLDGLCGVGGGWSWLCGWGREELELELEVELELELALEDDSEDGCDVDIGCRDGRQWILYMMPEISNPR